MERPVNRSRALAAALALLAAAAPAGAGARAPAAAESMPAPAPAPVPRVASVTLQLPAGEDAAALRALVAVEEGAPLSTGALRRTVQRLWRTGRFRNVLVRARDVPPPSGAEASSERAAAAPWVALLIEAQPVRLLSALTVHLEPPVVLEETRVRAVARLQAGEPFDDGDLAAAAERVRLAVARRGHRAAEVTARAVRDTEVELTVRPGEPLRIAAVRLTGDPGPLAATALRARPGAVLDEEVLAEDTAALRRTLHAAGFRRGRVGVPAVRVEAGLAVVEIPVEAGPRLAVRFAGNAALSSRELEARLGLEPDAPVDAPALAQAGERLRLHYRSRGFAAARVEVEEVRRGGALAAVFHVEEGRRYRLGAVRLEGLAAHPEPALRARIAATLAEEPAPRAEPGAEAARALLVSVPGVRVPPGAPPQLPPGTYFEEDAWDQAAERLVDDFRAEGWLEAVYLGAAVELDARRRTVAVTLRFREGPRTIVESISFEGNQVVPLGELAREARLAPQDPLVWARVEATRAALQRLYLARGHLYARVETREQLDRPRHAAAIRFVVHEGPQVRIGRVLVTGNKRTRDEVVREAVTLREGDVYDPEAIGHSQTALLRLGVFRSVALRVQDPETPHETKDLSVELAERPRATLTQGFGYSLADGPRATGEFGMPNLLGRALELTARAKVNYPVNTPWGADSAISRVVGYRTELEDKSASDKIEGRADLGLRTPRLGLPFLAAARADVLGEILHRRAYDLRRIAAIAGLDFGVASRLAFSLQYEVEVDDIEKLSGALTQADLERLRFDEGVTTLHAVRPSLTLDRRDNSIHPHSGWYASAAAEWARSLGTGGERVLGFLPGSDIHTNLVKLAGTVSGYLPVGSASVLALSLRGGRVFPLDARSRTIIPRRFFMGGAATMRGYAEEEMVPQDVRGDLASEARHCATSPSGVGCTERGRRIADGERPVSEGGEAYVLAKAELRVPVRGSLEAGLFVDLGNLWLDPERYRVVDLRANAGFGLRFVTPIGPAAIDFGLNLEPDRDVNERTFAPHFTIGLF
jgi:outer membrane protein assembly complex protein YaeT